MQLEEGVAIFHYTDYVEQLQEDDKYLGKC